MKPVIVGFPVGLRVGKAGRPDMNRPSGMNNIDRDCRECRVFIEEETVRDSMNPYFGHVESQALHLLGLE